VTNLSQAGQAHVDAIVRVWLGLAPDREVPTLPPALARRLLRLEEYEHRHRDQWGNWEFGFCEAMRDGRLWEPDVDRWVHEQRRALGTSSPWPEGRPFAICLSHDVDLISDAVTPHQAWRSMRLSLLGAYRSRRERAVRIARPAVRAARALYHGLSTAPAAEALERCVEIEHEHGVTASYFFTVYPEEDGHRYDCTYGFADPCRFGGERVTVADVARTLDREGLEVGLHGSFNSAVAPGRLRSEREALEAATGLGVRSTRQHFLHWDIRATPALQSGAGISADSTLGFNRNIGLRAGTSLPFRWFDAAHDKALDLVELPMLIADCALLRSDALELGLELATDALETMLDRLADAGGAATLVFHPNNFANADNLELFRRTIAYGIERGAWFASVRELDAWYRARA